MGRKNLLFLVLISFASLLYILIYFYFSFFLVLVKLEVFVALPSSGRVGLMHDNPILGAGRFKSGAR
jgi:hypothetical protein